MHLTGFLTSYSCYDCLKKKKALLLYIYELPHVLPLTGLRKWDIFMFCYIKGEGEVR